MLNKHTGEQRFWEDFKFFPKHSETDRTSKV